MHEMGLLRDLLRKIDEISRAEAGAKVVHVNVWLGAFSHISADHFREHFEEMIPGHPAQDAVLEVVESDDESHPHAQEIVLESVELAT